MTQEVKIVGREIRYRDLHIMNLHQVADSRELSRLELDFSRKPLVIFTAPIDRREYFRFIFRNPKAITLTIEDAPDKDHFFDRVVASIGSLVRKEKLTNFTS